MEVLTAEHPKCMTEIAKVKLSEWQLKLLQKYGITEDCHNWTFDRVLMDYCRSLTYLADYFCNNFICPD